jgi:hypothetical protein
MPADRLRSTLPDVRPPFTAVEFRARPGLVNYHLRKNKDLVGMIVIEDLLEQPEKRALFARSPDRVQGCPSISTSMGGGLALLYKDRFRAEVIALTPAISDRQRRRWLEEFHLNSLET